MTRRFIIRVPDKLRVLLIRHFRSIHKELLHLNCMLRTFLRSTIVASHLKCSTGNLHEIRLELLGRRCCWTLRGCAWASRSSTGRQQQVTSNSATRQEKKYDRRSYIQQWADLTFRLDSAKELLILPDRTAVARNNVSGEGRCRICLTYTSNFRICNRDLRRSYWDCDISRRVSHGGRTDVSSFRI